MIAVIVINTTTTIAPQMSNVPLPQILPLRGFEQQFGDRRRGPEQDGGGEC